MDKLKRRFFRLTFLNILSNVTVPLVGLVDTAMLGHLPQIRFLAGVALASVLFEYLYWSFGFLRMGTTGMTAQALGRQDDREAFLILYRSLALAVGIAFLILIFHPLLVRAGFALLAGTPEVEEAGLDYFSGRIWGAPAVLCNFVLIGWFLGREESGKVLWLNVVANLANVGLNYLFIIHLQMAALGAGIASMLSQYLMLMLGLILFWKAGRRRRWRWREVLEREKLLVLLRLNSDILFRTLGLITTFSVFVNISALLGTSLLAANAILQRLLILAAFAIDGVAFASESLSGIFLGQRDRQSLRRLVTLSLGVSLAMAVAFVLGMLLTGSMPFRLLTSHQEVIALAVEFRFWFFATLLFGSIAFSFDGIFLGMTAGRLLRNSMLASSFLVFLPLALAAVVLESNTLLWAGLMAFMISRGVLLGFFGRKLWL